MAKEIIFEEANLTFDEIELLTKLVNNGKTTYLAPVEIEHKGQLEVLNITWGDCHTWYIGSEKVTIYLSPSNKRTYDFLLEELRKRHHDGYRSVRCMIPGKLQPPFKCPDVNKCSACPFGKTPEDEEPINICREEQVSSSYEPASNDDMEQRIFDRDFYLHIRQRMMKKDSDIATAFEMSVVGGYTAKEIAEKLNVTKRRVYYLIQQGKNIGQEYRRIHG